MFSNNACGRGGAGFLNDDAKENMVVIERNLVDRNAGTEPDSLPRRRALPVRQDAQDHRKPVHAQHRDAVGRRALCRRRHGSGQKTTATLNWNIYRGNSAGNAGGGMFCDEGATCLSYHEIYDGNCGGNIYLDSGVGGGPTIARFDHLTNVGALDVGCKGPGPGVRIDRDEIRPTPIRS